MKWVLTLALLLPAAALWAADPPPASSQDEGPTAERIRQFELLRQRTLEKAGLTPQTTSPAGQKAGLDEGPEPPSPGSETQGDAAGTEPSPDTVAARFRALKLRTLQKSGIDPAAGGLTAPPPPPGQTVQQQFAQHEAAMTAAYDEQFGKGAYAHMLELQSHCFTRDGCDRGRTADFLDGANKFVGLKQDVAGGLVAPGSAVYERRHGQVKNEVAVAVVELRPRDGAHPRYEEYFYQASEPVVQKVFTPAEQLRLALRTAGDTDSAPGYNHAGKVLASQGRLDDARQAFGLALQRDPKYAPAYSGRALAEYGLRDYPAAARDASKALELLPSDEEARQTLALSQGRMQGGSFAGLNRDVKAPATEKNPLGGALADAALAQASDLGAAAQSFGLAGEPLAAAPASPAGLPAVSAPGLADARARAAAKAAPLVAEARKALAGGDAHGARMAAQKAALADPRSPAAQALLSVADNQLQDYTEALSAASAGLALAPRDPVLLLSKATALNHLKRHAEALAVADSLLAVSPKNAVARFNRAEAMAGLGRRREALEELKQAAELDPRFAPVYDEALQLSQDSDMAFLFGEEPPKVPAFDWARAARPAAAGLAVLLLLAGLSKLPRRRAAARAAPPPLRAPAGVEQPPRALAGGRYELKQRLGGAGVAVVYAGYDTALRRPVVVKRLRDELRLDAEERRRFLREGKALASLRHPNIVRLFAVEEEGEDVFLVFDRPDGRTLADILSLETRLPFLRARALYRGVAAALDHAHAAGVEHRDLRPASIVLGEDDQPRLLDFGLARLADVTARRSDLSVRLRASAYMAPEQRDNAGRKESDVYGMAACLYETLTGRPPYRGVGGGLPLGGALEPPTMLAPGLPAGVDEVFARALAIEPHRRYPSASALQRALETLDAPLAA